MPFRFSRVTFRCSWNLSFFAVTFRFSECLFDFHPWLMAGHPLPINRLGILKTKLTSFLREKKCGRIFQPRKKREKPKNSREEPREKKRKSSLQISVPDPVTSSVEIRTRIKALRLVRPHAPQVVRLARKTLGQECSRDPIIAYRKIIHQSKYWDLFSIIVK